MGNKVTGYSTIQSVTYHLAQNRPGSSLQAAAIIRAFDGNDGFVASVNITSLLPSSGASAVKATFVNPPQLDPRAIYLVAFCTTGAGDGQFNLYMGSGVSAGVFCFSDYAGCTSSASPWGFNPTNRALGTVIEGTCPSSR
jgi:hypothetical protein